jgi:uncharacterized protein
MTLEFEWDDEKAAANLKKHGVGFERAALAFSDPLAVELPDVRENYGEERTLLIALQDMTLLAVVFTERGDRIRIISARRATRYEQNIYLRKNS